MANKEQLKQQHRKIVFMHIFSRFNFVTVKFCKAKHVQHWKCVRRTKFTALNWLRSQKIEMRKFHFSVTMPCAYKFEPIFIADSYREKVQSLNMRVVCLAEVCECTNAVSPPHSATSSHTLFCCYYSIY